MATTRSDQLGLVVVPPTTGSAGVSLEATCEPALYGLLADFKAILRTKLDAAWAAAAGSVSKTGHVVEDTRLREPTFPTAARTWNGPALFMWRQKERFFRRTQVWDDMESTVKLAYVLPAYPEDILTKLSPIRVAVRTTLVEYVENFGDPTLKPGTALSTYGIESFTFTDFNYGELQADSNLEMVHPVLDMTALMRERKDFVLTQYANLSTIATTITSKDDAGVETTVAVTTFTATST